MRINETTRPSWRTAASTGAWVALVLFAFAGTAPAGATGSVAQAEIPVSSVMRLATCEDPGTGDAAVAERMVRTGRAGSIRAV